MYKGVTIELLSLCLLESETIAQHKIYYESVMT